MDNSEFALKLEIRTQKFALSIINLSTSVKDSLESKVLRRQIVKSGTSIGENYREANRARSRPDFAIKIRISEGEASETVYWRNLLIASKMVKS